MHSNILKSSLAMTIFAAISSTILPVQAALLVSSSGDNSIKQYDEITGAYIRDFVTAGSGGLSSPNGLDVGLNGNLFVSSRGTNSVKEYSGTTGEYVGDFVSFDDGLRSPIGLTFAEDGSLFVVGDTPVPSDNVLRSGFFQYDGNTGELLSSTLTGARGFSSAPIDVVVGGLDNTIFISQSRFRFNSGSVDEFNPITGVPIFRDYINSDPSVTNIDPRGLAITDNFLYYTDNASIGRFDLINNVIDPRFVDVSSGGLTRALDVAIGANGNLFVSDSASDSVKQYDGATGNFLGDFVTSSSGGLSSPTYLTTANVPVPEPSSVLGIAALGGLFVGGAWQRKANRRKQLNFLQK
ncbi:MAG: PEP-CTERM sorting domain-containing protein [Tatlockia sp.]|nr:PEP-CTERM sorting domain-containing protein [Tatlockia sp.]